jgi:transaldolase
MPEATLLALAGYDKIGPVLSAGGGDCEQVLSDFMKAGIDLVALAARLQEDGAKSFVRSWNELLAVITSKGRTL